VDCSKIQEFKAKDKERREEGRRVLVVDIYTGLWVTWAAYGQLAVRN